MQVDAAIMLLMEISEAVLEVRIARVMTPLPMLDLGLRIEQLYHSNQFKTTLAESQP